MAISARLFLMLLLGAKLGCQGVPESTAQLGATVHGRVLDEDNLPMPGTNISQGSIQVETDANGEFSFLTTDAGQAGVVVVEAQKASYAHVLRRVPIAAGAAYVQLTMRQADVVTQFIMPTNANDVANLSVIRGDTSAALGIFGESLQDSSGKIATGEVQAILTLWSPNDLIDAYPGALRATLSDGTISESSPRVLRTYGMLDISLQQNGQELQIVAGQTASLELTTSGAMAQNYTTRTPAYAPPTLWTLDSNTGLWSEDVGDSTYDPNTGTLHATLRHLSTKNSDEPITQNQSEGGCIRGKVIDQCGVAVAGASVTMYLQSELFWGTTLQVTATSDATGTYAMAVNPATHMSYFGYAAYRSNSGAYFTTNTINSIEQGYLPDGIETLTVPGDVPEYTLIPMAVFLCSSVTGQCVDSACQCFNDVNDDTCLANINIPGGADGRNPCWVHPMGNDVYGNQCFPQYNGMYKAWQGVPTGDLCQNCWPLVNLQLPFKRTPNCTGAAAPNPQADPCATAAASTIRGEGDVCSVANGDVCCPSIGAAALVCADNVCVPASDPTAP